MNIKEFFKKDKYAGVTGIELIEAGKGYSKAKMEVKEFHLNAGGVAQGGAVFTLADFAIAVAANAHGKLSLALNSSIAFLKSSNVGDVLYAEVDEQHIGRSTSYYVCKITNQNGDMVANVSTSMFRKSNIDVPVEL